MAQGGSLSYRLGEIEKAIPYNDVNRKWASTSRNAWVQGVLKNHASASKLAGLCRELMDAFTPGCISFLWSDESAGFTRVRDVCTAIMNGKKASAAKELKDVRRRARKKSALCGRAAPSAPRPLLQSAPLQTQ